MATANAHNWLHTMEGYRDHEGHSLANEGPKGQGPSSIIVRAMAINPISWVDIQSGKAIRLY